MTERFHNASSAALGHCFCCLVCLKQLKVHSFVLNTLLSCHRIPYGPHIIPFHLCPELDAAKVCDCGRACLDSFIQTSVSMNLHLVSHTVVLVDDMGGTEAPVQRHFCSLMCYCEFLDNCVQRGVR